MKIKNKREKEAYNEISTSLAKGIIPLSIYIPDENTMKEMIEDEFCKVCGREAKKGSDAHDFMVINLMNCFKAKNRKIKKKKCYFSIIILPKN
jgi:DNA sulfur modification protein DndD